MDPIFEKEVMNINESELSGMVASPMIKGRVIELASGENIILDRILEVNYDGFAVVVKAEDMAILRLTVKRHEGQLKVFADRIDVLSN